MSLARERLTEAFPGIVFTDAIVTPAYGMKADVPPYSNFLAKTTTDLQEARLVVLLKELEKEMGDTQELRRQNIVMMDIDLLQYGGQRHHDSDWQRPYVKRLLPLLCTILTTLLIVFCVPAFSQTTDKKQDAELLGKAVEYYQGGKYQESILAFEKLEKRYKLNPRFKAYLGMSYFKVSQYKEAVESLKIGIPELSVYSPKEQAVYIYSCAESLFRLERYNESIDYYTQALPITEGNDKGDVLFHTAFAHHFLDNDSTAIPLFQQALALYKEHSNPADELHSARLRQTEIMLRGLIKPREAEDYKQDNNN